jgi:hypothetical protein
MEVKEIGCKAWTGFMWLGMKTSDGLLWTRRWTFVLLELVIQDGVSWFVLSLSLASLTVDYFRRNGSPPGTVRQKWSFALVCTEFDSVVFGLPFVQVYLNVTERKLVLIAKAAGGRLNTMSIEWDSRVSRTWRRRRLSLGLWPLLILVGTNVSEREITLTFSSETSLPTCKPTWRRNPNDQHLYRCGRLPLIGLTVSSWPLVTTILLADTPRVVISYR